jgi:hypothetical protein
VSGYSAIERQEGTLDVFLPSEDLTKSSHRNGISTTTVRESFEVALDGRPVLFQLATMDGVVATDDPRQPTDLVFWSWIPVFSARARQLLIELGVAATEFVPCLIESRPNESYFLHLPERAFDVVDVERSEFAMTIPLQPPLPHGIRALVLRGDPTSLPPCFRASVPGHAQVFGELLVSDALRDVWTHAGLSGAVFRQLSM